MKKFLNEVVLKFNKINLKLDTLIIKLEMKKTVRVSYLSF